MKKLFCITIAALLSCNVLFAVDPPTNLDVTDITDNSISLAWTPNANNDNVMITTNVIATAGPPENGNVYPLGSTLPGGGLVIYTGSDLTFDYNNLLANQHFYFQAWSVKTTPGQAAQYSSDNVITNATTTPEPGVFMGLVFAGLAMVRARKR